MLEADGEKFHFLNCDRSLWGHKWTEQALHFLFGWNKQKTLYDYRRTGAICQLWYYLLIYFYSLIGDILFMRDFVIHAIFPMMNCKMIMDMFVLQEHICRLLDWLQDQQKVLMLEADGEKFHFLSCLVHGVTCEQSMHCFPTLVNE